MGARFVTIASMINKKTYAPYAEKYFRAKECMQEDTLEDTKKETPFTKERGLGDSYLARQNCTKSSNTLFSKIKII